MAEVGIIEHEEYWELSPLVGMRVTRCLVDYSFTLQFVMADTLFEIRIGNKFTIHESKLSVSIIPEDVNSVAPALRLFGRSVEACIASKSGSLFIIFDDGATLSVEPDPDYEAWDYVGEGQRIVSSPGGQLVVWCEEPGRR